MLELQNIRYSVPARDGQTEILRDISLTIPDKKLIVLTGPNGGGKTTLAKTVMGLVAPTSGRILWNGEDVTELSITERARRGISYGFQQPPRFKGIRVKDLLAIAAGQKVLPKGEACFYLTACAQTTTSTVRWTLLSPAARSSASRSPPFSRVIRNS